MSSKMTGEVQGRASMKTSNATGQVIALQLITKQSQSFVEYRTSISAIININREGIKTFMISFVLYFNYFIIINTKTKVSSSAIKAI